MVWYFLLTVLVDNLITPTEDEWQIAADIRDGQMNAFLVKPFNYLGYRSASTPATACSTPLSPWSPVAALVWFFRADCRAAGFPG